MKIGDPWIGQAPESCDVCERKLMLSFVDGKTRMGPWAIMCPTCRVEVGPAKLGLGMGQKFERKPGGSWVKVA